MVDVAVEVAPSIVDSAIAKHAAEAPPVAHAAGWSSVWATLLVLLVLLGLRVVGGFFE